ncbi:type III secretion system outer membrane ring subunit SctC [Pantoea ananatis]|uniref:type III secretion system outer membrane ring subunit SctC n=1 Tax=Pantoea ananas TaxID=553 RepID=UPI0021E73775|nr:type III secretion system outer membrane ring subunit SctC [Pantoea ananatis]MCW0309590.1 Type 3 secretion system secretin [Pantoea ananatis]MCW0341329.1 Type 3 secretion system secretin [Pantoea ananatis]MCW0359811.1 Type 3 secretion system secretin [Pantoea ananatis]MCW0364457.1 Type 3 secretion system secretin [Pantoea ananatis]MCW1776875.1 type III secretion system outer membrane ring subunit SctC [Pantoea ananatis]
MTRIGKYKIAFFFMALVSVSPSKAESFLNTRPANESFEIDSHENGHNNIYVANNNSLKQFFYVLGDALHKPFVVSNEAGKKRVSGNFDLNSPKALLEKLASRTGLIWYDDGSAIYVYDSSEIKSSVIRLRHAPFERLTAYLQSSGLYDPRFPVRSNGRAGSFYVSGPPVYVQLITAAAKYIDGNYSNTSTGETTIRVIKLRNTFVNSRQYSLRDTPVTIPGIANVLNQLLNSGQGSTGANRLPDRVNITVDNDTRHALLAAQADHTGLFPPLPSLDSAPGNSSQRDKEAVSRNDAVTIIGYPDTNSLLIKGTSRQVGFVEDLIRSVDTVKRQIQLSLWIIDISKDEIDQLGVDWQGRATLGGNGVTFNISSLPASNGVHFLAKVTALADKGQAQVVSRPEILTQENVPALFDHNTSFYARLQGERAVSLEKITFGTMISVQPRLSEHHREIEMILNIQDGGLPSGGNGQISSVDKLPLVHNTQISTQARVPVGYSLLVGGYNRDEDIQHDVGIPGLRSIPLLGKLFDYSYVSHKKMVRMFLIQPVLLQSGHTWQGEEESNPVLGRRWDGDSVTLKSTVSMLRAMMN